MKCAACARETMSQYYCRYHEQALEQLRGHYEAWVRAYSGKVEWGEYLARLLKMPETGAWAKEVIETELLKLKK